MTLPCRCQKGRSVNAKSWRIVGPYYPLSSYNRQLIRHRIVSDNIPFFSRAFKHGWRFRQTKKSVSHPLINCRIASVKIYRVPPKMFPQFWPIFKTFSARHRENAKGPPSQTCKRFPPHGLDANLTISIALLRKPGYTIALFQFRDTYHTLLLARPAWLFAHALFSTSLSPVPGNSSPVDTGPFVRIRGRRPS